MSENILKQLKERFPDDVVKKREGPKKKVNGRWIEQFFSYIPTDHLHERLDDTCGLNWNWEILGHSQLSFNKFGKAKKYNADGDGYTLVEEEKKVEQIVIWGRLTIRLEDGSTTSRDAFGGCDLTYGSQAGDSFKIADSNAFKKACYKFGIGRYLGLEGLEDALVPEQTYTNFNKPANPYANKNQAAAKPNVNIQITKKGVSTNPFQK